MILAIIQARMTSTRLPGKVLMSLASKPMLRWVYDAACESKLVDCAVVATSTARSDNRIATYCYKNNLYYARGSLDDVLDRFYQIAKNVRPNYIVRLTADCPLLTGEIIDRVIGVHLASGFEYTRNDVDGFDVEVFSYDTLLITAKLAKTAEEREHVTAYMRNGDFDWIDTSIPDNVVGKYSVDTEDELEKIRRVMEGCMSDQNDCLNVH